MSGSPALATFLAGLPPEDLDRLYREDASTARFVFRHLLPPLAQQFTVRLVFMGAKPVQEKVLQKWTAPGPPRTEALSTALEALLRYRVLVPAGPGPGPGLGEAAGGLSRQPQQLVLQRDFAERLRGQLRGQSAGAAGAPGVLESPAAASHEVLHNYAVSRWEALLRWLTPDPQDRPSRPSVEVERACMRLGLKEQEQLTPQGFRFVLNDRQHQLWALLIAYLQQAREESIGQRCVDGSQGPLQFLLSLSEANVGQAVTPTTASSPKLGFIRFLVDIGVLWTRHVATADVRARGGAEAPLATPAALALFRRDVALTLSRSLAGGPVPHAEHGEALEEGQGIIVESNFKVYAYTSGHLHATLLGLFCKMVTRLPNLVVAHLTAEPALQAMKRGICVDNMVRYLESSAHPRALKRLREGASVVPANVRNQLEVWEASRSRTSSSEGVLFEWTEDEWDPLAFEAARACAEALGGLLWARGGAALATGGEEVAGVAGALAVAA